MAERSTGGSGPLTGARRTDQDARAARDGIVAELLYAARDLRAGSHDPAVHDLAARLESLARRVEAGELSIGRARQALQAFTRGTHKSADAPET